MSVSCQVCGERSDQEICDYCIIEAKVIKANQERRWREEDRETDALRERMKHARPD